LRAIVHILEICLKVLEKQRAQQDRLGTGLAKVLNEEQAVVVRVLNGKRGQRHENAITTVIECEQNGEVTPVVATAGLEHHAPSWEAWVAYHAQISSKVVERVCLQDGLHQLVVQVGRETQALVVVGKLYT
jgi:hypothetical protein